jgi:phosphatidylserine synthase
MVLIAILGLLMVSTLRYTSFKNVGSGRRNLYILLVIAATGMSIWLYSRYVLLILSTAYVSHGVIWYLISLFRTHPSVKAEEVES